MRIIIEVLLTVFDLIWMSAVTAAFIRFIVYPLLHEMEANKRTQRRAAFWWWHQNRFN